LIEIQGLKSLPVFILSLRDARAIGVLLYVPPVTAGKAWIIGVNPALLL
jgi:hypothetical protein